MPVLSPTRGAALLEAMRGRRILVLGDSFTVGVGVAQDEIYPTVLETLLTARSGRQVDVVNAAVGGWSPFQ